MDGGNMKYLLAILALYLVLAVPSVFTKLPWCDEAWQAAPAFDLMEGGTMGVTCYEPAGTCFLRLDERTYWEPPVHYLSQAGWCSIFGKGLFQVRFHSVFWGLVALLSMYFLVNGLLYHRGMALLATGLLAIDFNFVYATTGNRMDTMSVALTLAGLAAYVILRKNHLGLAVSFSHILIVLSGLTHPNGILGFMALIFLTLYLDRKRLKWSYLEVALFPYVIGAFLWGTYIMQDYEAFASQFYGSFDAAGGNRLYGLTAPLQALKDEILLRYGEGFGFAPLSSKQAIAKLTILLSYLMGVCLVRNTKGVRVLWWIWLIYAFGLTFLMGSKTITYLLYITPFFIILFAVLIVRLWDSWRDSWRISDRWMLVVWLVVLAMINLGITVHRVVQRQYTRFYLPAVAELSGLVGEDTVVMGSGEWGFELGFDNVIDDVRLGYCTELVPDVVVVCKRYEAYFDETIPVRSGQINLLEEPALSYTHELLDKYHLRWENDFYKIFTRN